MLYVIWNGHTLGVFIFGNHSCLEELYFLSSFGEKK